MDLAQDSFWQKLAEKERQEVFNNKTVFKELYKIMMKIADQKQKIKENKTCNI